MYLVLSLLIIVNSSLYAKNNTLDSYLSDASISVSNGDLYRAYKLYSYAFKNYEGGFESSAIEEYMQTTFKLASTKRFVNICKIFSKKKEIQSRVNYQCAKLLYESGNYDLALEFSKKVKEDEKLSIMNNLLLSSIYLANKSFKQCLETLDANKILAYKKYKLVDVYNLTKARCYNENKKYNEAIRSYQAINSNSKYYFNALYEMTWSYLKIRDLRGVNSTTEAIFSMYNPNKIGADKTASTKHYYESKYILAFLDLLMFTNKEQSNFKDLDKSLNYYKDNYFLTKKQVKSFYDTVTSANSMQALERESDEYKLFFYSIEQWLTFSEVNSIKNTVVNFIATSKEIDRIKKYKIANKEYLNNLNKLKLYYNDLIKKRLAFSYDKSKRVVNGFILKIKIADLEFHNLQKTQGLRSLEEASLEYKNKESNINIKLGAIND